MSAKRVVITGLGATSPVGGDVATTWSALLEGQSGVSLLTEEWAEPLAARIAGHGRGRALRGARPGQGPATGPVRPVRADRGQRGVGGLRPGRRRGRRRTPRRRHGVWHRRRPDAAQQLRHTPREGPTPGLAAGDPDAHAQLPRRQRRARDRRQGRGPHPGVGLRLRQRGDRARHRHDPARPGRRRGLRWHRGGRARAAHGRVREHDGAVQAQRRPRGRFPTLGQGPRRVRPRARVRPPSSSSRPSTPRPAAPGCTPRPPAPA